jgi:hypothetical protein
MCSLHPRIAKKCSAAIEEIREAIHTEASDDSVYKLKLLKQKSIDECMMLKGCAAVEKYLKVLRAPTPPKKNLVILQNHVDELIKIIR